MADYEIVCVNDRCTVLRSRSRHVSKSNLFLNGVSESEFFVS